MGTQALDLDGILAKDVPVSKSEIEARRLAREFAQMVIGPNWVLADPDKFKERMVTGEIQLDSGRFSYPDIDDKSLMIVKNDLSYSIVASKDAFSPARVYKFLRKAGIIERGAVPKLERFLEADVLWLDDRTYLALMPEQLTSQTRYRAYVTQKSPALKLLR